MKNNILITGGAGGMGEAAAELLGKDNHIILVDNRAEQLEAVTAKLKAAGIDCESIFCDVAERKSVEQMFASVNSRSRISTIIHAAGISPQMAAADRIVRVNSIGTVNITELFYDIMEPGSVLINVSSMASYMLPGIMLPVKKYKLAEDNPELFIKKVLSRCRIVKDKYQRRGVAYSISKNFVIWYTKKNAVKFGRKKSRILSISPGTFDTEMSHIEEASGSIDMLKDAAIQRMGLPREMAELFAFCISDKAAYLTGVDILCDGGVIASRMK